MKYIDAGKLKYEIERRNLSERYTTERYEEELYEIIDSLEDEQPVEGLEDEIKRYLREECSSDDEPSVSDIARHFAEWQKKRDDLETADLLAIAHLQGMEQQKGNIKNLLKSWAENELDEHPNKNDDFRLAIYSLVDKLNDL